MTHYLFFDVDGTLIPFGKDLPADTLQAVRQAREKGSRLFLATGRSPAELDPRLSAISFDGGVYSGGARAFVEGKDIYASYFSRQDLDFFIEESQRHGWRILLQCDSQSYYAGDFCDLLFSYFYRYIGKPVSIVNLTKLDSLFSVENVTKLILLTPEGDMERAHEIFDARFDVLNNTVGVPSSLMSEVCQKNVNKGRAMLEVLRYYNAGRESSIAFGDGANDFEIIQMAGLGIAMGNADESLKQLASYVTADCDDDGIGKALRHFGVI